MSKRKSRASNAYREQAVRHKKKAKFNGYGKK